jgi:hypothetical protein
MAFDLNIICILEKEKYLDKHFSFSTKFYSKIISKKRMPKIRPNPWKGEWAFMCTCVGYWYHLLPVEDESEPFPGLSGCYIVCNAHYSQQSRDDFEIYRQLPEGEDYPKFDNLYDEWEYYTNISLAALEIKQEYREDFEKIIDYFLERSPVNMIIFLPRYQGSERDNIQGVLKRELFFEMLDTGKIKFNTCYIISNIDDNLV